MKLNIQTDCGNSPKMELVKNLTILFASYDLETLSTYFEDRIRWTLVGDEPIEGKENFLSALRQMADNKASQLTIHTIVTHGKEAAISGEMVMQNGEVYAFADFYLFSSAKAEKIKSIRSYVVKL